MNKLQLDILERAFWTALQAFVAFWLAGGAGGWKAGLAAAIGAGLSILKGSIASFFGNKESASTIPTI